MSEDQIKGLMPPITQAEQNTAQRESLGERALEYALVGAAAVAAYTLHKYGAYGGYGAEISTGFAGIGVAVGGHRFFTDAPRVQQALSRLTKA